MPTSIHSIFVHGTAPSPGSVAQCLASGLPGARGETWAVKLNLTSPRYIRGVVNSPVFVEGMCQWARDHGVRLVFVEGAGGNGSYSVEDTFRGNGLISILESYGVRYESLSEGDWDWRETSVAGRTVRLPYSPFFTRREYDRFITAPLFKNHVFTFVTLGMKNLWGCIPDSYRMYYHHLLDRGIVALYKELRPDFSIFDGIVGLRGRGPMEGSPVDMNMVMVSSDTPSGEAAALHVMGVPLEKVRHLQYAKQEGLLPDLSELSWRGDPAPFLRQDFHIDRLLVDHLSVGLTHFPSLMRVVYHSPLSKGIYAVVNRMRGSSSVHAQMVRDKESGKYTSAPLRR